MEHSWKGEVGCGKAIRDLKSWRSFELSLPLGSKSTIMQIAIEKNDNRKEETESRTINYLHQRRANSLPCFQTGESTTLP